MNGRPSTLMLALLLGACQSTDRPAGPAPQPAPWVFDGHSDVAIHYLRATPRWSVESLDMLAGLEGQADIPRWRAGGVGGALITVGSDQPPGSAGHFPRLLASLAWFDALPRRYPDHLVRAASADDLRRARQAGKIALMPAIEGGDQIDGSLENLRAAYAAGVRSMTIVYDHHNAIGDGAMVLEQSRAVATAPNGGLSAFGRSVILEMNRLGMLVDLSHAGEETVRQAFDVSRAPVIFSHSGARTLAETPRNLSDETLRALRRNGGIAMVPMAPYLTTTAHWRWWASGETRYAELVAAHPDDPAAVEQAMAEWDRDNPEPAVTVFDVANQVDHIAHTAGFAHVGIGTDFDGMGRFAVRGLSHAGELPALFDELRRRGWSEDQLRGLAGANFERVLAQVEEVAGQ